MNRRLSGWFMAAFLAALVMLCAPLSTAAFPRAPAMDFLLTSADNGQTVTLHQGARGELRLPETPTSGYRWTLQSAPPILAISEAEFTPRLTGLGGGGERRWLIQARTTGMGTLSLKRWRDWEGESSVMERYQVTFQITPPAAGP